MKQDTHKNTEARAVLPISDSASIFPPVLWGGWLEQTLGKTAFALLAVAMACYVAANWPLLSSFARLGIMAGLFATSVLASLFFWARKQNLADACLFASGLLGGAFWVVFSQIYQTGANAWGLFAIWAGTVLPWLLLRPSIALWCLWLVLLNVALLLWSTQSPLWASGSSSFLPYLTPCLLLNMALWLFWRVMARRARLAANMEALRMAWRWSMPALFFLLLAATIEVCRWLLYGAFSSGFYLSSGNALFSGLPAFSGLAALLALLMVTVHQRLTHHIGVFCLLALCGFPLVNCAVFFALSGSFYRDIGLDLFLFTVVNFGYTGLVLHSLVALRHLPSLPNTPPEALADTPKNQAEQSMPPPCALQDASADLQKEQEASLAPSNTQGSSAQKELAPKHLLKKESTHARNACLHARTEHKRQASQRVGSVLFYVLSGLGALLSALFLAIFSVVFFMPSISDVGPASLFLGLAFLALGLLFSRDTSLFARYMSLCVSLTGLGFFWLGLAQAETDMNLLWLYMPCVLLLCLVQRHPVWRFFALFHALWVLLDILARESIPEQLTWSTWAFVLVLGACFLPLYGMVLRSSFGGKPESCFGTNGNLAPVSASPGTALPDRGHFSRRVSGRVSGLGQPFFYAGLGIGMLFFLSGMLPSFFHDPLWDGTSLWIPRIFELLYLLMPSLALLLVLGGQAWSLRQRNKARGIGSYYFPVLMLFACVCVFLAFATPALVLAVLLMALGHACRHRFMSILGALFLTSCLVLLYYHMPLSFLDKAFLMGQTGLVLLACCVLAFLWNRRCDWKNLRHASLCLAPQKKHLLRRAKAFVCLLISLTVFGYTVNAHEKVLTTGKTVLLRLAPIDPLSLVQGYYMSLDYELNNALLAYGVPSVRSLEDSEDFPPHTWPDTWPEDVPKELPEELPQTAPEALPDFLSIQSQGGAYAIIGLLGAEEENAAQQAARRAAMPPLQRNGTVSGQADIPLLPDGRLPVFVLRAVRAEVGALAPDEYALPFRAVRGQNPAINLPYGFLFTEGMDSEYARAAFGVFRCLPEGPCVLAGLADENGRVLGSPGSP